MTAGPLDGIVVVEVATGMAAALAGRMMAGYGAEVVKVEPLEGDPMRALGPFPAGQIGPETSATFHYFHGGKRSVVLDLAVAPGRTLLGRLLGAAQVLLTDMPVAERGAVGLDKAELRDRVPSLSIVSITPYGESGPYAQYLASDLTQFATGGQMSLMGDPDREPLKSYHNQAECQTAFHAFGAAMTSIMVQSRSGAGQYVELSTQEIQASSMEAQGPMAYNHDPFPPGLEGRTGNGSRASWGQFKCQDGYAGVFVNVMNMPAFFRAIGYPEWVDRQTDMEFMTGEFLGIVERWCAERTRAEVYEAAVSFGAPFSYVAEPADLLTSEVVARTGIWRTAAHPIVGDLQVPGPPFRSDAMPFELSGAPLLGEHTAEVLVGRGGVREADVALLTGQAGSARMNAATMAPPAAAVVAAAVVAPAIGASAIGAVPPAPDAP